MILVSHPTGNTFVRALIKALDRNGQLHSFHTTVAAQERIGRGLTQSLTSAMNRRSYDIDQSRIHTSEQWRELARLFAGKLGLNNLTRHETGWASMDQVCRALDRNVAQVLERMPASGERLPEGVYCYEDCALETFRTARQMSIKCNYDLPIAYWETSRKLLAEEAERWPAWEPTLGGTRDSEAKLQRKAQEIELADVVVCPSKFVLNSIPNDIRDRKQCLVSEFGTPNIPPAQRDSRNNNGKLRVLFAGSMSQRKGLADLFQAMRMLNRDDVELVVLGSLLMPMSFYKQECPKFVHEATRPNAEVLELMRTCDVFCLPSIVEGRALVQQEAMACGLPLVVTPNAGGEDLVDEGRTGFLVPIRSPQAIAEKISWFADNRDAIEQMRDAARSKAEGITWQRYSEKILQVIIPRSV